MARVLVIYASTHGHTGKIAARIASRLAAAGHRCVVGDCGRSDLVVGEFDAVIVGASIHRGSGPRSRARCSTASTVPRRGSPCAR